MDLLSDSREIIRDEVHKESTCIEKIANVFPCLETRPECLHHPDEDTRPEYVETLGREL